MRSSAGKSFGMAAAVGVGLVLLHLAPYLLAKHPPLQDYPNHLARQVVVRDLVFNQGKVHGGWIEYRGSFRSYAAMDWIFLAGFSVFPRMQVAAVGHALVGVLLVGLPLALAWTASRLGLSVVVALLLGAPFAYHTSFALGNLPFCFGLLGYVVGIGIVAGPGRSVLPLLGIMLLTYAFHPLPFAALVATAVGYELLQRRPSLVRAAVWGAAGLGLVLAGGLTGSGHTRAPVVLAGTLLDTPWRQYVMDRLIYLQRSFLGFEPSMDGLFAGLWWWTALFAWFEARASRDPRVERLMLIGAAGWLVTAFLTPTFAVAVFGLPGRPVIFAQAFLVLGACGRALPSFRVIALGSLLVLLNAIRLTPAWYQQSWTLHACSEFLKAHVVAGSVVYSDVPAGPDGVVHALEHRTSLPIVERGAAASNLFTGLQMPIVQRAPLPNSAHPTRAEFVTPGFVRTYSHVFLGGPNPEFADALAPFYRRTAVSGPFSYWSRKAR